MTPSIKYISETDKHAYSIDDLRPCTQVRTNRIPSGKTHQLLDEFTKFIRGVTYWVSGKVTVSEVQVNIVPLDYRIN